MFALALLACGPNPKAPVQVMAIVPSASGHYESRQVALATLTNATAMKGTILEMVGGNRVVWGDTGNPLEVNIESMTPADRYEVLVRDKGWDVRANWVERGGVLWPADFHTWNMVSSYYNFERAYLYYQAIIPNPTQATDWPPELSKLKVMYWPDVRVGGANADPWVDNALFLSTIQSFVLVPNKDLQMIPLAMNLGVIGHEMGHKVYNHRALDDAGIHPALWKWAGAPVAFNLFKSLDEGLADYHGYGVTCLDDTRCLPNFLAASWSDTASVTMRDVSRNTACLDATLRTAFTGWSPDQWVRSAELYKYGNLIAATLYQVSNKLGDRRKQVQTAVVASYDDENPLHPGLKQLITGNINNPENFTPEAVMNVFAGHLSDPDTKKLFCNEVTDRLQLACSSFPCALMPNCPNTSARGTTCPVLPTP